MKLLYFFLQNFNSVEDLQSQNFSQIDYIFQNKDIFFNILDSIKQIFHEKMFLFKFTLLILVEFMNFGVSVIHEVLIYIYIVFNVNNNY